MLIGMVALGWDVVSATPSGRGLVVGILLLAIAAIGPSGSLNVTSLPLARSRRITTASSAENHPPSSTC